MFGQSSPAHGIAVVTVYSKANNAKWGSWSQAMKLSTTPAVLLWLTAYETLFEKRLHRCRDQRRAKESMRPTRLEGVGNIIYVQGRQPALQFSHPAQHYHYYERLRESAYTYAYLKPSFQYPWPLELLWKGRRVRFALSMGRRNLV